YHDLVHARIKGYERHEVFANQYQSYRLAVEWLKQEVEKIDTEIPTLPFGFVDDDSLARESLKRVEDFSAVSLKFHVLAKSLVVNAAFMCDALVSTLLRVGAQPPLRADLKLLRPILRASFMQRLEVIHAYTVLFKTAFDSSAPEVAGARRLMEKRNKYVHGELSEHTRLDDVYFDGDFPLYGGGRGGQIADFRARTFMVPSKVEVLDDVANAERFDSHVRSMIRPEYRHEMEFMLSRPQLGYNTQKRVFSVPFSSSPFQLVMSGKRARTAEDRDGAAGAADSAPQETALASPDVGRGDSIPVR
ncbi:MAG: hypothetical protein ACRELY_29275, partial [Polyangiaceae bacterium]